MVLATTKSKQHNKPTALVHKSIMKKEFCIMVKAVENPVAYTFYMQNLKKVALA